MPTEPAPFLLNSASPPRHLSDVSAFLPVPPGNRLPRSLRVIARVDFRCATDREDDGGGVGGVVVDLLLGGQQAGRGGGRLAGARVARVAREGAAGDLDPDPVTALEAVRGRPQPHVRLGDVVS